MNLVLAIIHHTAKGQADDQQAAVSGCCRRASGYADGRSEEPLVRRELPATTGTSTTCKFRYNHVIVLCKSSIWPLPTATIFFRKVNYF